MGQLDGEIHTSMNKVTFRVKIVQSLKKGGQMYFDKWKGNPAALKTILINPQWIPQGLICHA